MKTYQIFTRDGKSIGTVEGDNVDIGPLFIIIYKANVIQAVCPVQAGYAVVIL